MEADMNQTVQMWMPPVLALFGTLMVVVITAWLNTKALSAQMDALRTQMDALRAEVRQEIAEAELRIVKEILELKSRVNLWKSSAA
jgi:uncharacterized membrane-anchored protein YhcB (DUF1043 family)